jgi:predicted ester cyclase
MVEDLKAIARRTWEEIFPSCDVDALREVTDANVIGHGARPEEPQGFEGVKRTMLWLGQVFADQRWDVHQVIREGDTVVVHCTHHGRHVGDLMRIAPTNREVAYDYIHILRFRDGKAIEHWGVRDHMTLMRQLGVLRDPRSAAVAAG